MSHRKWRGYATFEMPKEQTKALMTICPGNPDQEGSRFRSIMEAAGAKLDYLYIIEAAELGYHNLKRLICNHDAQSFAKFRGQCWQKTHQPIIDEYMGGRCEVIPMADIVADQTYKERIALIREIYDRGNNPVTKWFDYSADLDIQTRANRKEKEGVLIEPWAIKENSIDYLCDEYAMLSIMWEQFSLQEIYRGLAVNEHDFFQRENTKRPEIDLTIPKVCPITIETVTMVHNERLGCAFPSNDTQVIPEYAKDLVRKS